MRFRNIPRPALIVLFVYAALSKLLAFDIFQRQMLNQVFRPWFDHLLVCLVPLLEIVAVALLLNKKTGYAGLWLSAALMAAFTAYTGLVLLHFWKRVPCSCGGILGHLSWGPHLLFNSLFLALSIWGIYLEQKERRLAGSAAA